MTSGIETIGGHTYFVVRDDAGNIVQQEAREPIAAMISSGQQAANAIDPAAATLADVYRALLLILKKQG